MDRKSLKRKAERASIKEGKLRVRTAELLMMVDREDCDGSESEDVHQLGSDGSETENECQPEVDEDKDLTECLSEVNSSGSNDSEAEDESNPSYGADTDKDSEVLSDEEEPPDVNAADGNEAREIEDPGRYVREQLVEWTLLGGVSMNKVDDLLARLKPVHPILPLSYKTLLQTPKSIKLVDCGNGSVWYLGICRQLPTVLSREYFDSHKEVLLDINIDSLPIFNKSNANFVPILGRLVDVERPFIIGIFCGKGSDPQDLHTFFEDFVEEVNRLVMHGFMYDNVVYNFQIRHYILDQKARASVKCVKSVRGYYCCEKCTVKGVDYKNRMCLLDQNCPLRTDEDLVKMAAALMIPRREHYDDDDEYDEHVNGISPLWDCEQKLVSKFRLDSMHLVYKGVFLRWLDFLWDGRGDYSLSPHQRLEISNTLGSLRKFCPCDFNRKPYAIKFVSKLKATELRRILLYDGLLAFRNLDRNIYKNFLLLHCAIYILCSPRFHKDLNQEANQFLRNFVTHYESLFGPEFIVYNVHSLIHLAAECMDHGELDQFGAFVFENYLGMIKSQITSRAKPLQQVAKRVMERSRQDAQRDQKPPPRLLQMPCINDSEEQLAGQQYKKILVKGTTIIVNGADSCCELLDGSVVIVKNIIDSKDGPVIVGRKFSQTADFYSYPIPSSLLGIYKVSDLSDGAMYWNSADVKHKCFFIPLSTSERLCVPLLHSHYLVCCRCFRRAGRK